MNIGIGKKGLSFTWQADFPEHLNCPYCGGKQTADIAFVAMENNEEEYVCKLHPNDWQEETDDPGYWLHDAGAYAVYFCRTCFHPVAEYNQG